MKKLDYFIEAVKADLYIERAWLLSTFGIQGEGDGTYFNIKDEKMFAKLGDQLHLIDDYVADEPLFGRNEKAKLKSNMLSFIEGDMDSTYGLLILNCLLLWYPYKGIVKYYNQKMTTDAINAIAYDLIKNAKVDMASHLRYENACSMITCLTQVGVPSASRRSITPNPEAIKLKNKLLAENKDRLGDAAVVADIQAQLVKQDKEYMAGDSSLGMYISGKNFSVHRLKTEGMYGAEPDFFDESKITVMEASLNEGWKKDNLQMLINNLRGGSFARGKETALGGESTKVTSRIFQNYRIDIDDCNTTLGLNVKINSINASQYIGRYLVGRATPLTHDDLLGMAKTGKVVQLRSPAFCKGSETSFCKKCFGDSISNSGMGLNSQAIIATSTFMGIAMSAMHSRELKVGRLNWRDRFQ